ncbi:MAG TPA: S-layer homology domain-containing protein [Clostridiales bacterium]|nr:S-layer homology domain-containing protein [Clostridiales bacterium]
MKRILALILSVLMITSLAIPAFASAEVKPAAEEARDMPAEVKEAPAQVQATSEEVKATADKESGLEDAIKAVKRKFDIPDKAKFDNYSVYDHNGEKVWYLNWYDNEQDIRVNVTVTSSGKITNYNYYKPYDYSERKFPKFGEEEALEKAKDFIRLVAPEGTLAKIEKQDYFQNPLMNHYYYFNFYRSINGTPFYINNLSINVNSETGEVHSYYYNMDEDLIFPDAKGSISLEDAEKAYAEKLGLKLIYQYSYDSKKKNVSIYPVYVPKYDNNMFAVDAITGEKIQTTYPYYGVSFNESAQNNMKEKDALRMAAGDMGGVVLTPEEIKAAEEQSNLLTEKNAEKIARETSEIGLDDNFQLRSWYLNRSWPMQNEFVYNLQFEKAIEKPEEKRNEVLYVGISLNAKTGEIISFYTNNPYTEEKPKYDEDTARTAVEEFLKKFKEDKFDEVEFQEPENYSEENPEFDNPEKEPQRYYYFNYIRKVNGIHFPGNSINVGFDAVNGKVTNFNMNWFDVEFPGIENVLSLDEISKALLEKIGLELQYRRIDKRNAPIPLPKMEIMELDNKPEIKLVYALKSGKPYVLDANTGDILDYDGKPFKEEKPVEYTDLSGHFSEGKVKELAKYNIITFKGPEFKPNDEIKQKDLFMILSKLLDRYYVPFITEDSSQDEIDEMYKQLVREGIVKAGEKAPESAILREDAVKFLIRALKYDKIADVSEIFNVTFKDAQDITPELKGYVAIASGLGIISGSGGNFNPKKTLTRGEAAVMIYNYLD